MLIEIEGPASDSCMPVEQQIVCPQCGGFISTLISVKRVLAYPAPVGDYYDDAGLEASDTGEIPHKPIESEVTGTKAKSAKMGFG